MIHLKEYIFIEYSAVSVSRCIPLYRYLPYPAISHCISRWITLYPAISPIFRHIPPYLGAGYNENILQSTGAQGEARARVRRESRATHAGRVLPAPVRGRNGARSGSTTPDRDRGARTPPSPYIHIHPPHTHTHATLAGAAPVRKDWMEVRRSDTTDKAHPPYTHARHPSARPAGLNAGAPHPASIHHPRHQATTSRPHRLSHNATATTLQPSESPRKASSGWLGRDSPHPIVLFHGRAGLPVVPLPNRRSTLPHSRLRISKETVPPRRWVLNRDCAAAAMGVAVGTRANQPARVAHEAWRARPLLTRTLRRRSGCQPGAGWARRAAPPGGRGAARTMRAGGCPR